jgi:hypothetical protein
MARFVTSAMPPPAPKPGVHVARIIRAKEKFSENGNPVLRMTARFPDLSELSFAITFVERAAKLIQFFCRSCELELPNGDGIEVEISPADVLGRLFYLSVELGGEGIPKITKFLSRAEALAINPALEKIALKPQAAITLPVVRKSPAPTASGSLSRGDSPSFQ